MRANPATTEIRAAPGPHKETTMIPRTVLATATLCVVLFQGVQAADFSYASIAKRHPQSRLDAATVERARMDGECLVGLKQLNFQKRHDFDPVAEWTNYRSLSLLEQFPPCAVLIMIEVARAHLVDEKDE